MTSQQIGEALELPAGTVRYKLHRARARLTDRLEAS
jgi:DNA-directed RNA polymerase specialized sigma24 family protein